MALKSRDKEILELSGNHGIIVIHGKAAKLERGEFLAKVTNAIADTLQESPVTHEKGFSYPTIDINTHIDNNRAEVTLDITKPRDYPVWKPRTQYEVGESVTPTAQGDLRYECTRGGRSGRKEPAWRGKDDGTPDGGKNKDQVMWKAVEAPRPQPVKWIFREAYWNDAFLPPPPLEVLLWARKQLPFIYKRYFLGRVRKSLEILFKDPLNLKFRADLKYKKDIPGYYSPPGDGAPSGWLRTSAPLIFLQLLIWSVIVLILRVILFVFGLIIIPLYLSPLWGVIEWVFKKLGIGSPFPGIEKHLSESIGDVQRYLEHGVWADNARSKLEDLLTDMLKAENNIADVTIIAESLGAMVAFDALRDGGEVAKRLGDPLEELKKKKITLVTIGSGINQVMPMVTNSNLHAIKEFEHALASQITGRTTEFINAIEEERDEKKKRSLREGLRKRFFWMDIHARLDWVPTTEIEDQYLELACIDKTYQFKARRVINLDDFDKDHDYYWRNREFVVPRVITSINDGKYPWQEVSPEKKGDGHFKRLAKLSFVKILIGVASVLVIWKLWVYLASKSDFGIQLNPLVSDNVTILNVITIKGFEFTPYIWLLIGILLFIPGIVRFARAQWFRGI